MFWYFDFGQIKLRHRVLISSEEKSTQEEHAFYKPLSLRIKTPKTVFFFMGTDKEADKTQQRLSPHNKPKTGITQYLPAGKLHILQLYFVIYINAYNFSSGCF